MLIMNEDTRLILGSVVFMALLVVCIVIAIISQREVDAHHERQHRLRNHKRKAELRRKKEQEAAGLYLLDKVEEFRHDFDDAS